MADLRHMPELVEVLERSEPLKGSPSLEQYYDEKTGKTRWVRDSSATHRPNQSPFGECAPETLDHPAAAPSDATKPSEPIEAVPPFPRGESAPGPHEGLRLRIRFADPKGRPEVHAARRSFRAELAAAEAKRLQPISRPLPHPQGGLKARLAGALRAAARALDAGAGEP